MNSIFDMLIDPIEITCFPDIVAESTSAEPKIPDILRPYVFNNESLVTYLANPELLSQTKPNAMAKMIDSTGTDKKYWSADYDLVEEFISIVDGMGSNNTINAQSIASGTDADMMTECKKIYDLADIIIFKDLIAQNYQFTWRSIKQLLAQCNTPPITPVISLRLVIYISYYYVTVVTAAFVSLTTRTKFFKSVFKKIHEISAHRNVAKYYNNEEIAGYEKLFADAKEKYFPTL